MPHVTVTEVRPPLRRVREPRRVPPRTIHPVRGNRPLAELRPLPAGTRLGELPALLDALPRLSAAEAADFATDLEAARAELSQAEEREAWPS